MNNNVVVDNERRRDETTSPINSTRDIGINNPTIDFDDWAEDPFTLTKESDVFASFVAAAVEEEVANVAANSNLNANANVNVNAASFAPSSSATAMGKSTNTATTGDESAAANNSSANTQSRKRGHSQQSSQKQTNSATNSKSTSSKKKKSDYIPISRRKKKPKGMPKRPLSAYNLYFQAERTKIIANQEEGNGPRIGFEGLGKIIGKQWRDLSSADKKDYDKLAEKDSERYRKEMDVYHEKKAKRFEEEDKRAASQTPVLSSLASSANISRASPFDVNFMKQQGSLQVVPVREAFANSLLFTHPSESMVSAISSLAPGTTGISYRPIQVDQPPPPPRHALQHNNIMDALYPRSAAVQGRSPSLYFSQPMGGGRSEPPSYDGVALGAAGAAISAAAPGNNNNNCPMPPGMEVVLSDRNGIDRKYRVQYTCYSMTRENANKYIESLTGVNSSNGHPTAPGPPPPGPNGEYSEWGI